MIRVKPFDKRTGRYMYQSPKARSSNTSASCSGPGSLALDGQILVADVHP